jgi:hypothetical protein
MRRAEVESAGFVTSNEFTGAANEFTTENGIPADENVDGENRWGR